MPLTDPESLFTWKDIAIAGATALSGVVAYTVGVFTRRLDKHEENDSGTFQRIFDAQTNLSSQIATGFRDIDHNINEIHIKLLERISDVQQNHD